MLLIKKIFASFFLLFFVSCVSASNVAENIESIDLYFMHWSWTTRYPLQAEEVRKNSEMKMTLKNEFSISDFIEWLELERLKDIRDIDNFYLDAYESASEFSKVLKKDGDIERLINARLVIDIAFSNGKTKVYVSDGRWLFDLGENKAMRVSDQFLRKFHFRDYNFIGEDN